MKFCKDCKWHKLATDDFPTQPAAAERWALCVHPVFLNPGNYRSSRQCGDERTYGFFSPCGKRGKLFEPKES